MKGEIVMCNFYKCNSMVKGDIIRIKKTSKQTSSLPNKTRIFPKKEVSQKEEAALNFYDVLYKVKLKSQFEDIK